MSKKKKQKYRQNNAGKVHKAKQQRTADLVVEDLSAIGEEIDAETDDIEIIAEAIRVENTETEETGKEVSAEKTAEETAGVVSAEEAAVEQAMAEIVEETVAEAVTELVEETVAEAVTELVEETVAEAVGEPVEETYTETVTEPVKEKVLDVISFDRKDKNEYVSEAERLWKKPKDLQRLYKGLILFAAAAIVCFLGFWLYESSLVYKSCSVEAGVKVSAADFLKKEDENAYFTEASDEVDITVPGEYHLVIQKGIFTHKCVLKIADTIAPEVEAQSFELEIGKTCEPKDFIKSIKDATKTEAVFVQEPDYSNTKPQMVEIAVTDAGNNTTVVQAELSVRNVVKILEWEAGSEPPVASDFLISGKGSTLLTDLDELDLTKLVSYDVEVELDDSVYAAQLKLVDTIPPEFKTKKLECSTQCKRSAEEFVSESNDVTELSFAFAEEPDMTIVGTQKVTIIATDEGGNQTSEEAELTLVEDTEEPVIVGAYDMTVFVGSSVSYKANVSVKDICPDAANLVVDSSKVNINEAGSYPVTYTATDCAGNTSSVTITLTVMKRAYDFDTINALADDILARILTDGMSQYDKAYAIFKYTKGSIGYISSSEKGDYLKAAYEGMVNKRGDCYVYASTAKVLLDRAGIKNMDIERIPEGDAMHYWNLVDIEDGHGWYHFDTTPRKDRPVIFLWNDEQIKAYSDAHNNCHNYDRSLYPVIY